VEREENVNLCKDYFYAREKRKINHPTSIGREWLIFLFSGRVKNSCFWPEILRSTQNDMLPDCPDQSGSMSF